MIEFRWIQMSVFLMLLLQITAGPFVPMVRDGEDVTLPCKNVTDDQGECGRITWTFTGSTTSDPVELILYGRISEKVKDRMSLTEKCSLVIKKVTAGDGGQYICQPRSDQSQKYLFVIDMTEHEDGDEVTLSCSVSMYNRRINTVKWLFEDKDVDKDTVKTTTSQSGCSATVTFHSSLIEKSKYPELFKCEVFDVSGNVQQFPFIPRSSGEGDKEKTTTTTTAKPATGTKPTGLWAFVVVPVVLAAVIVVVLIGQKRTKGKKTQVDPDTADPEDGVSYASISFNKKTKSKARVQRNDGDDDEDDAVTYTTVRVPSTPP